MKKDSDSAWCDSVDKQTFTMSLGFLHEIITAHLHDPDGPQSWAWEKAKDICEDIRRQAANQILSGEEQTIVFSKIKP